MGHDDFFDTGWTGHEVEKFRALLEAFESAWSDENGWDDPESGNRFRVRMNFSHVQLMELLRIVMQRDDFQELAVIANKRNADFLERKADQRVR